MQVMVSRLLYIVGARFISVAGHLAAALNSLHSMPGFSICGYAIPASGIKLAALGRLVAFTLCMSPWCEQACDAFPSFFVERHIDQQCHS